MNYPRIKYGMKRWMTEWNVKHPNDKMEIARMVCASPIWGTGAKRNFYRIAKKKNLSYAPRPTQQLVDFLFPPTFGEWKVRIARAEVGVKESPAGSNDGPRVRVYQKTTGAYKAAWCASFAKWLEVEAAKKVGKTLGWFTNPAYVPNWTNAIGGKYFKQVDFKDAKAGDVVTLWGSKHIETVVKRSGDYLVCIGGNTSPAGQNANGGMVAQTKRHKSEATKIGRRRS